MIVIDQFRISDDGRTMYLDAHVNKARWFKDIYIDDVTIVTDNQLLEHSSKAIDEEYIYKEEMYPEPMYEPLFEEPVAMGMEALKAAMVEGEDSWRVNVRHREDTDDSAMSALLTGEFSVFENSKPCLAIVSEDYKLEEGLEGDNVLGVVRGKKITAKKNGEEVSVWQFKGKAVSLKGPSVRLFLCKTDKDGNMETVSPDKTDNEKTVFFSYTQYAEYKCRSLKEIHLVFDRNVFNEKFCEPDLSGHMFFAYIKASGVPAPGTPCRLDEMTTVGVTFDRNLLYQTALGYLRELGDRCSVPKGLIDFILNMNALRMAIETDHYCPAIKFYKNLTDKRFHGGAAFDSPSPRPCGCHG